MRKTIFAATASLALIAFSSAPAYAFDVSFSWTGIPACQKISPAFSVDGAPPGTKRLRFIMTDLDAPNFHHGGSTVIYDGEDIPKGAIDYIGPCPPAGEHHRYLWGIEALDATGAVLARTTATQTFPP